MSEEREGPGQELVQREFGQAHQALSDAEKARTAGLSDVAVINRLYDRGFEPTSHGGVLSLFGSEVIAAGEAPREYGRFLNRLSELRQQADYGYEELDEDVDALLEQTQEVVSEMKALCSALS